MKRFSCSNLARLEWVIRTFPATLAIEALILLVALATDGGSVHHRLLVDHIGLDLNKLLDWQLWTLPASTVVQSRPGIGAPLAVFVAVALALLEYIAGSWRAALTFFLSDWISAPLTILIAWPLAHLGLDRAYVVLYRPDTGSSAAAIGTLAAALVFLPGHWRTVSLAMLFGVLLCLIPTPGLSANIAHLLGALVGLALGLGWSRTLGERHWPVERLTARLTSSRKLPDETRPDPGSVPNPQPHSGHDD
jgi:hypothetical protein